MGRTELLTDLQGLEDAAGDMDLKLAGSRAGLTAVQLDIKGSGVQEYAVRMLSVIAGTYGLKCTIAQSLSSDRVVDSAV